MTFIQPFSALLLMSAALFTPLPFLIEAKGARAATHESIAGMETASQTLLACGGGGNGAERKPARPGTKKHS
jgi:hypothetical protein